MPSPRRNSIGPQSEYPLGRQPGRESRQRERQRGEDRLARRSDVVVPDVTVREIRDGPVASERADADDVRQRRRIAGVAPRLGRRAVRVPDRRHDEHAPVHRILDGRGLEARIRVLARILRVADAAEAHVDDASVVIDRPVDRASFRVRRDRPVRAHDLGDQEVGRKADARDALAVVERRSDLAGDERAVAVRVALPVAGDEAAAVDDLVLELRVNGIDAGVQDGYAHGLERRELRPRVERVDPAQVPLAGSERVVRREREPPRGALALDPGDAVHGSERACVTRPHRERERSDPGHRMAAHGLDMTCDGVRVRTLVDPQGETRRLGRAGRGDEQEQRDEQEAPHAGPTFSVVLTPGTKPCPGASRNR